jgi:hypothetical protein
MEEDSSAEDIEDIFEDGLLSIFGDVAVSHGEPGRIFVYDAPGIGCPLEFL